MNKDHLLDQMVCYEDFADWLIYMADRDGDWQHAIQKPWKYIDEFRDWLKIRDSFDEEYE